jgi:hypothetical protein
MARPCNLIAISAGPLSEKSCRTLMRRFAKASFSMSQSSFEPGCVAGTKMFPMFTLPRSESALALFSCLKKFS